MRGWADLTRYRALALLAGGLLATLLALDLSLRSALGETRDWHRPGVSWHYLERLATFVAAAEDLQAAERLPQERLIVLLGMSSVLRDFDPHTLAESDSQRRQWLVLGAEGGTVSRLHVAAQSLLHGDLRCDHVLIGIHPIMLWNSGAPTTLDEDLEEMLADVSPTIVRRASQRALRRSWLGSRWLRAFDACKVELYRARMALLGAGGQRAGATFPPAADPWEPFDMKREPCGEPEAVALQWQWLQPRFTPAAYVDNEHELAALADVVRRLRDRAKRVTIVWMPEHSALRTAMAPEVLALAHDALVRAAGDAPLGVLDLRDRMTDECFYDYSHLNISGREAFSQAFPEWAARDIVAVAPRDADRDLARR